MFASPVVNVIPVFSSTAPVPDNELIVSVVSTSYVPELSTSTSLCKVPDTVTVPAEMVKSPVKVLVALKVKVPAPVFVKSPVEIAIGSLMVLVPTESMVKL